jgi:ABC-type branched-subunit amino acid transport system ATPase component
MLCLLEYCISITKKSDIFVTVIYHAMSISMSLSMSLSNMKYGEKTMTNSISHGKLKDEIHGCMHSKS